MDPSFWSSFRDPLLRAIFAAAERDDPPDLLAVEPNGPGPVLPNGASEALSESEVAHA